jgi:tyrosine-protein kinase Etk/Wzc
MVGNNSKKYVQSEFKSAKDYFILLKNNLKYLIIITFVTLGLSVTYAILAKDIYVSTVPIKIIQQDQNILESSTMNNPDPNYLDRFINNEIGIITNFNTREKTALALIDSFNSKANKNVFFIIKAKEGSGNEGHKSLDFLTAVLGNYISVEQNPGSDVIQISIESRSAYEAALIANTWASEYQKINLAINRAKLTNIRKFLEQQSQEKLAELKNAEDSLRKFQEAGGIISLDLQSSELLNQLSQLEAQKEATKLDLMTSSEILKQYKYFLGNQDPQLVEYLENETSQAYITALQQQLAELQVNRDLAISVKSPNIDISSKIREYDQRIADLEQKLKETISKIKVGGFSVNPEQVTQLAQRLVEEEVRNNSLSVRLQQLESATIKYEQDIKRLPNTSTKLAQYQRQRESLQQLYLLVNDKYQEAIINELSQEGNVIILGEGKIPDTPEKPRRKIIIIFGLILGSILSICFVLIKDYFDDTIKSPEEIEKKNIPLLAWIPQLKLNGHSNGKESEFVTLSYLDAAIVESFKTLRARVQYSTLKSEQAQVLLVTSPAEHEGKTFVSINLAASFALANKKTLIIDSDLRRPRIHSIMGVDKKPGLADFLMNDTGLDEIIREIKPNSLSYITAGSIPTNPDQLLESQSMQNFIQQIRHLFEVIIIDSPPIVAVIDAEIIAKKVDGTILVISSDKTENRVMQEAIEIIQDTNVPFLGTVLNNYSNKSGSGYYYKYHYNYPKESGGRKKRKLRS